MDDNVVSIDSRKEWNPLFYKLNSSLQYKTSVELIKNIPKEKDLRILDIGCGDGRITSFIASYFQDCSVIGLDISEKMVSFANKKYSDIENLEFVRSDAESLQHTEGFNLIVSFWAISWLKNHDGFLAGVYNALMPGGAIYLLAPMNNFDLERAILKAVKHEKWRDYFKNFQEHKNSVSYSLYSRLLKDYNFSKNVSVDKIQYRQQFEDQNSLSDFIESWLPHIKLIPPSQRQEFMMMLVDNYLRFRESTNKFEVKFDVLLIKARKC